MIDNKWINTKRIVCKNVIKPCHNYPCCPYGCLVELFPLNHGKPFCEIFGYDCPIFYHIEGVRKFSINSWQPDVTIGIMRN